VEYATAALERGLRGIIFTCHCPLPDGISHAVRMAPEQFDRYVEIVAEAREKFAGRLDVRLGLESDYYPGVEPWLEKTPRPRATASCDRLRAPAGARLPRAIFPRQLVRIQQTYSTISPARRKPDSTIRSRIPT